MPIKVKVIDNSSSVRVKPIDQKDEIKVKSGCDTKAKFLDQKINEEIKTREAEDKALDEKILREKTERKTADLVLKSELENKIETEVATETAEREAADQRLKNELESQIDVISEKVEVEKQERQTAIAAEKSEREAVDADLQEQINDIKQQTAVVDDTTIVLNSEDKISLNPILNANYLVVDTIEDRNAIPRELLKKGTLVKVDSSGIVYRWDLINWNKTPVNITSLGNGLKLSPEGELSVDTTDEAIQENKQPITSNGVYNILGDINDRLEQI